MNPKRIARQALVEMVASALPCSDIDDLPAIRQAINDTADSLRKDGYTVEDFDQPRMVKSVRSRMKWHAEATT